MGTEKISNLEGKNKTQEEKIQQQASTGKSVAEKDVEIATMKSKLASITKENEDMKSGKAQESKTLSNEIVTLKTRIAEKDKTIQTNGAAVEKLTKEKENEVSQLKKQNSENEQKVKEQAKKFKLIPSL